MPEIDKQKQYNIYNAKHRTVIIAFAFSRYNLCKVLQHYAKCELTNNVNDVSHAVDKEKLCFLHKITDFMVICIW